jgi:hypothetical protein
VIYKVKKEKQFNKKKQKKMKKEECNENEEKYYIHKFTPDKYIKDQIIKSMIEIIEIVDVNKHSTKNVIFL